MKCLGLMSGTSADGVDCAIVDITRAQSRLKVKLLASYTFAYPPGLRQRVLLAPTQGTVAELCHLHAVLGEVFAKTALQTIQQSGLSTQDIRVIGSHGQTVYHQPAPIHEPEVGPIRSSLQIGDPSIIAERTGITTVADFRTRDIAAGGEGAPLAPYGHYLLFHAKQQSRLIVNLGGIANVTFLPTDGALLDIQAFDTGPCNMLLDGLVMNGTGGTQQIDRNGGLAKKGRNHPALLKALLSHPYLAQKPPKSTGRETFGASYITAVLRQGQATHLSLHDTLTTSCAFVARTIVEACQWVKGTVDDVILGGGGVKNLALMDALKQAFHPRPVRTMDQVGVDSQACEAMVFAIMAYQTIHGVATNVPSVTGARHAAVLGMIVPGKKKMSLGTYIPNET